MLESLVLAMGILLLGSAVDAGFIDDDSETSFIDDDAETSFTDDDGT